MKARAASGTAGLGVSQFKDACTNTPSYELGELELLEGTVSLRVHLRCDDSERTSFQTAAMGDVAVHQFNNIKLGAKGTKVGVRLV